MSASRPCRRTEWNHQHLCEHECAILEQRYLIVDIEIFKQRIPTSWRCVVERYEWCVIQMVEVHPVGRHFEKRSRLSQSPPSPRRILQLLRGQWNVMRASNMKSTTVWYWSAVPRPCPRANLEEEQVDDERYLNGVKRRTVSGAGN